MNGFAFLVCAYNGAVRLPQTLAHLAAQQVLAGLAWEVVLVSNASTDDTLTAAPRLWAELGAPAPLRVLDESRPGKPNALARGIAEACYEYICIVDDDNWLAPDYLVQAVAIMDEHSEIGILGGVGEAVCEVVPPAWFADYAIDYAAESQAERSGDMTQNPGFVWGAGSVLRRSAWQRVQAAGFESLLVKYPGVRLSGEDVEMCYALALAGFRIWFDERLHFQHFIPSDRLTWPYLCSLYASSAGSEVDLRPYRHYLQKLHDSKPLIWLRNGLYSSRFMFKHAWRAWRAGHFGSAVANVGNRELLRAAYFRQVLQHYVEKQIRQDTGFERVAAFVSRLHANP